MKKKQKRTTDAIMTIDKSGNVYEKQAPKKQKPKIEDVSSTLQNVANRTSQKLRTNTREKEIKQQNVKIANKNYNEKLSIYNKASETYQKKRGEELRKRDVDLSNRSTIELEPYKNKILSYATKQEDIKTPQQKLVERAEKQQPLIEEANKATEKESQAVSKAANDYVLAKYQKNVADVDNKDIGVYDKTLGAFLTGVQDIGSNFVGDNKYIDENGNTVYLPNKAELTWQKTRDSYGDNVVGKLARFGGDVAHEGGKIAATGLVNAATGGIGGSALYFSDIFGDQYKQNINEGYDEDKAGQDALLKTGQNYIKQRLIGGLGGKLTGTGPSWLEKSLTNTWSKAVSNPVVSKTLASMSSEAIDEFTDEWIESAIDSAVLGKDFDPMQVFKDSLYSGAIGGATGAFGGMGDRVTTSLDENRLALQELNTIADQRIQQIQQEVQQDPTRAQSAAQEVEDIQNYVKAQTNTILKQAQTSETTQPNAITQETQNVAQNDSFEEKDGRTQNLVTNDEKALEIMNKAIEIMNKNATPNHPALTEKQMQEMREYALESAKSNREYIAKKANKNNINEKQESEKKVVETNQQQKTTVQQNKLPVDTNDKVTNFRNSVANENVNDADGFYKSVEKIIKDKDYNVILDSSITNEQGNPVNAVISNENGITIRINPKSERAGEILLTHEITHGIETKEMSNLIMDYASKNSEFNDALQDLKKAYGTEDITPEVVADISGQLLGKQEFIKSLSIQKPNIFKQIFDKIIDIANKLTGNSNKKLFIKDLKNKWEKAYRESNIQSAQQNLKEGAKYSQNAEIKKNFDNEGNKLTKGQQNFFDKSYARVDEKLDRELVTVYHTNKYVDLPFYEFKPQVAPDYHDDLFENQTVIYATDSQKMSGSYAEMEDYVQADTHRYEKIEEVQEFLDKLNEIGHRNGRGLSWIIKDVSNDEYYKDYNKMMLALRFKNSKNDPETLHRRGLITEEEYQDAITPAKYIIQQSGEHVIDNTITFKSKDDLLRNWKNKLSNKINETSTNRGWDNKGANKERWQYKGYLNIEKPYIVDAQGGNYKTAERELKKDVAESFDRMAKFEKELYDLAQESRRKYRDEFLGEKSRNLSNVKRIIEGISNEGIKTLYDTGFIGTEQDYNRILEAAESSGMNVPSYDTKVRDITNPATVYIIDEYGNETDKSMLDMTFGDFIKYSYDYFQAENDYGNEESWFKKNFKNIIDDDIDTDVLSGWRWYKIANKMFNEPSRKNAVYKYLETNDVVAKILRENKNLDEKYDGIIFKNIVDYGHAPLDEHFNPLPYEEWEPATVYVVFNSNQFKAWDNKNPTNDPDMRYSQKADKWQKFLDKYYQNKGTTTILKDKIGTIEKETQQEEKTQPEILDKMPTEKKSTMKSLKKGIDTFRKEITDRFAAVYDMAQKTRNKTLYHKADRILASDGMAQVDIDTNQVNLNGKPYKNFTDENGNKVSMSLEQAYDIYNKIPNKDKNTFLVNQLNIDRLNQGVDQFEIPLEDSERTIAQLREKYPDIDKWSENIYQYYKNLQDKLVESGRVSQELANKWRTETPHYVHIQRDVQNKGNTGVSVKNGKIDSDNLIRKVKGGNYAILPIKDTTAKFTQNATRAITYNDFGKEYAKTIGYDSKGNNATDVDMDEMFGLDPEFVNNDGNGNYTMKLYENGGIIEVPISEDVYKSLSPQNIPRVGVLAEATTIYKDLLTNKNPFFGFLRNPIKDVQDMFLYSKHPLAKSMATYTKLFAGRTALRNRAITRDGVTAQDIVDFYHNTGNAVHSIYKNGQFDSKNRVKEGMDKVLSPIEKGNDFMESMPRITEFWNTIQKEGYTLKDGELVPQKGKKPSKTVEQVIAEASYNAADVTVNFKRGGRTSKAISQNGGIFFNPSVQGASKFARNITEAVSDAKSGDFRAAKLLVARAAMLGLAPAILSEIMYGDDDEYKEIQDYQKDQYYIIKGEDGKWIRIPKGRAISLVQSATRRGIEKSQGREDAFKGYGQLIGNQIAPNNPLDNNIFSPITSAATNKSWSGNKIVSDSMAKRPVEEQFNEKTDEFSKWIGKKLHISPMKVNYVIDQYSGVLGDLALPQITPKATTGSSNPVMNILRDNYSFNAANSNKNVGNFYDTKRKWNTKNNSTKATEEDKLKSQYMNTQAKEMYGLYTEKQKIQMDKSLSKKEKYEQSLEVQKKINEFAKKATENVKKTDIKDNTATVGNTLYYKDTKGEWHTESEKTKEKREDLGLTPEKYYYYRNEESYTTPDGYSKYITSGKNAKMNMAIVDAFNFDTSDYLEYTYKINQIKTGNTAKNKQEVAKYINSLPLSKTQKAYLYRTRFKSYRAQNNEITNQINKSNLSKKEKEEMYSYLGLGR